MSVFLETKRLVVKAPTLADYHHWCELHAESDVIPQTKEVVLEWLNYHIHEFSLHGYGMGSVFLKDTNEFVGRAGLFNYPQESDVEIGYIMHIKYQNMGYATELISGLIDKGFNYIGLNKIVALTRCDNKKSIYLLEKSGLHYVKQVSSDGEDFLLYEICK